MNTKHTYQFNLCTLDVWGNEECGFDINNVYKKENVLELSDDMSDEQILELLAKDTGTTIPANRYESDRQGDFSEIYFHDTKTGKPEFALIMTYESAETYYAN